MTIQVQLMHLEIAMKDRKIILETIGLTKHYGGVQALNDANFTMFEDEHVAIVGDNGAGKSTFVRTLRPLARFIRVDDLRLVIIP